MRLPLLLLACTALGACAGAVPPKDPLMAWVDVKATPGTLVMADSLDRQRLADGRYFQITPGPHDLLVRYDYELRGIGTLTGDPQSRTCYLTVHYEKFAAGQHYVLEARDAGMRPLAFLYDDHRALLAQEGDVRCAP